METENGQASAHGPCPADANRRRRILGNDNLHSRSLLRCASLGAMRSAFLIGHSHGHL
jgi:hypothetical protein